MPKSTTFYLNDVNVWIALVYDGHQHHDLVRKWFATLSTGQARFCRFAQLGLFGLLTNGRVMGRDVLTQTQAWETYDGLCRDPRVAFQVENEELDSLFRSMTQGSRSETNV